MVRGGGFTGLVITTTVDSATLSDENAEQLRAMVDAAPLADQPLTTDPRDRPDAESFRITIEDNGERRSLVLGAHELTPAVRSLIDWVESAPSREESVDPPG